MTSCHLFLTGGLCVTRWILLLRKNTFLKFHCSIRRLRNPGIFVVKKSVVRKRVKCVKKGQFVFKDIKLVFVVRKMIIKFHFNCEWGEINLNTRSVK